MQHAANQNRFSQLDQTEAGSPSYYEGRGSGGRFRQGNQQDRGQYGGRNSRLDLTCGWRSQQKYHGFTFSAEAERARAIQTARDMTNNRSQSVIGNLLPCSVRFSQINICSPGPHPTLSRENSAGGGGGQRSYSMVHTSATSHPGNNASIVSSSLLLPIVSRSRSEWV